MINRKKSVCAFFFFCCCCYCFCSIERKSKRNREKMKAESNVQPHVGKKKKGTEDEH